jgi:predicted nucleotidyltransferase
LTDLLVEGFEILDERVQLTASQRQAAEHRGQQVLQTLSQCDVIAECRLVGSMVRSTAIKHFSDIDILAVFEPLGGAGGQDFKVLLDLTEQAVASLGVTVARTDTTVSVRYGDWPCVDILPVGFTDGMGRDDQSFHTPGEAGRAWQFYSPSQHDRIVQNASVRLGSRYKKIVRNVKWWNCSNGRILRSYAIEMLVNDSFPSEIPVYTEAIQRVFGSIVSWLSDAGAENGRRGSADSVPDIVRSAWLLACQAREMATLGRRKDLELIFRRLFGEQFPVSGN